MIIKKIIAIRNILVHLLRNRKVIRSPLKDFRLFMERTESGYEALLSYRGLKFKARKADMNAVQEVLVKDGYGFAMSFVRDLPETPVVLDFGANVGCFALRVFAERPDAKIVSVEAASDTFALLLENKRLNPGLDWQVLHAGVWRENGELHLDRGDRPVLHRVAEQGQGEVVPALSVASIRSRFSLDGLDMIKMDIEGAEAEVVPACAKDLTAKAMVLELHSSIIDPVPVCEALALVFSHARLDRTRESLNPVLFLANCEVDLAGTEPIDLMERFS